MIQAFEVGKVYVCTAMDNVTIERCIETRNERIIMQVLPSGAKYSFPESLVSFYANLYTECSSFKQQLKELL